MSPHAKLCGCKMEPVADEHEESDLCSEATGSRDGRGWIIVYCSLHAQAAAMREALRAAVLYDEAIEACADDPGKMASFCTAKCEDLNVLYAAWIDPSRAILKAIDG